MTNIKAAEISKLLNRWGNGDESARDKLFEVGYPTLRQIAERQLARQNGVPTLSARDVIHESFLKLHDRPPIRLEDSGHFYALLAKMMRGYVIDHYRSRNTKKRGGRLPLTLDDCTTVDGTKIEDWLALNAALTSLEEVDPQSVQLVELKFFGGLTTEEIAKVLNISVSGVVRQWRFARAWLSQYLGEETDD